MVSRIEEDKSRFDRIVRGRIKNELRKYITHGEMIGRKGKDYVSIPLPQIEIPHFRYGKNKQGGVGQGEGEVGDPVGSGGDASGAGDAAGEHMMEVELSIAGLAKLLGEELELPRIEPRGTKNITSVRDRYVGIRHNGPESLRHFKRSFREALKREMATGRYDPVNPVVVPV